MGYGATTGSTSSAQEIVIGVNGGTGVQGKGSNTAFINANGGGTYNGANSTLWAITSDKRIKKNIVSLESSLGKILALNPVEFDYKENDKHEVGFIAQDYKEVFPDQIITHKANSAEKEIIGDDDDEILGIQQNLVPYLVKAIQDQQQMIIDLQNRLQKANID
jgi:hypothetical protein